jgi:hypothetical protein
MSAVLCDQYCFPSSDEATPRPFLTEKVWAQVESELFEMKAGSLPEATATSLVPSAEEATAHHVRAVSLVFHVAPESADIRIVELTAAAMSLAP